MSRVGKVASATVLAATILLASFALAAPSARLVYVRAPGAESCPDESAIRAAVSARLGYDPFFASAGSTMFAEVSREPKGFRAKIRLVDDTGTVRGVRELAHEGDRCADMIDTMALSMSIAIDPTSLGPAPSAAPTTKPAATIATSSPSAVPSTPPASPPPPPSPPEAPHERVHLQGGLGVILAVGAAPAPNIGGALFLRAQYSQASLALEGRLDFPSSTSIVGGRVESALAYGSLVPCVHHTWFGACFVTSLGVVRATAKGVTTPTDASAFHAAVGPRVMLDIPVVDSFSFWTHVTGSMTLTPQTFQLGGVDVYALSRLSLWLGMGASLRFF